MSSKRAFDHMVDGKVFVYMGYENRPRIYGFSRRLGESDNLPINWEFIA